MRVLTLKVLALLTPFVALSLPSVVQTLTTIVKAERSVTLRDGVFEPRLESKWQSLVTDQTGVIIAGDSRAERQIVPAIVEQRLGRPAANVATDGQDLITLSNEFKRHPAMTRGRVLIASVSLFQINDGATESGYISTAAFLNMTSWERTAIYADRLGSPWSPLAFTFVDGPAAAIAPDRLPERGFRGIDKTLLLPLPPEMLTVHPWYRNISLHGARWRIFQDALAQLAGSGLRIYLVQPPVSPAWRAYTAGTFVDESERQFSAMLQHETARYANVRFLDCYTESDPRLGNEQFYDIQHLNRGGAHLFTEMLMDRIAADLRLAPIAIADPR